MNQSVTHQSLQMFVLSFLSTETLPLVVFAKYKPDLILSMRPRAQHNTRVEITQHY